MLGHILKNEFNSLYELTDYFHDEIDSIKYFAYKRWGDNPVCPFCDCEKVYSFSNGITYKCSHCRKQFNPRIGTIFENSKISMKKWFIAIYLISSHKKGISSYQLAKDISVTQKTAFNMLKKLRYAFKLANLGEMLDGVVEVDESFVGGKNRNRHKNKKVRNSQGRAFIDKTPVLGMLQRGGKLMAKVIPNTKAETIIPIIEKYVKKGSTIYSDEWWAYKNLHNNYTHAQVYHNIGVYGIGNVHTNGIEGSWASLKRSIIGVYHSVSRKHLQKYVDEFVFRYNTRNMKEGERLNKILSLCCRNLTYYNTDYGEEKFNKQKYDT